MAPARSMESRTGRVNQRESSLAIPQGILACVHPLSVCIRASYVICGQLHQLENKG